MRGDVPYRASPRVDNIRVQQSSTASFSLVRMGFQEKNHVRCEFLWSKKIPPPPRTFYGFTPTRRCVVAFRQNLDFSLLFSRDVDLY